MALDDSTIDTAQLRAFLDKQEITECLLRYTRGVDRLDEDLIRSAFHPDAIDFHGSVNGTVEEFLAAWLPRQDLREVSQHYITNINIDLDADTAHVESYFVFYGKLKTESDMMLFGGRYVDRVERRENSWRIALRVVIREWGMTADGSRTPAYVAEVSRGTKDRSDPSYLRPLTWSEDSVAR
jgi:hypothetical protein